ncbi:acyl-CoA synthetase FdrA [Escherichia coli]|nr:acyl-CoA synthetase FdrA [Escherichia coli]MDM8957379.1 acyl-CoA synthetase FdrA [Escherichia coli]MDM8972389.1 acyl-CoA synthetase FdrA [Escherichia coli]MDM8977160.1 acyl-CoA synthetase FdrA [Escherichia coli]
MIISRKLSESENVDDVSVMMGTPANKALLDTTGFWHDDFNNATPNDICVAIRSEAADAGIAQAIMQQLEEALKQLAQGSGSSQALTQVRRWDSACQKLPDANLALISVAGEYAAELANQALDRNLNVMMFSDNVTLEDEIQLKTRAREKGLLVMGPDCGTSMIAGTPLAFANVMPEGNIGVIGASGTGIQELCSQIALAGEGITHAIGLGGRDLSREVGGISALTALEMLSADEKSEVLAFVSKPPAEAVRLKIVNAMKATGKPTVALFLGYTPTVARDENVWFASSLDEAARLACLLSRVTARRNAIAPVSSGFICGLYTGGTLAAEAAGLLAGHLGVEADDTHHHGMMLDADGHQIIDLGDDFYTVGRPHPHAGPPMRWQEMTGPMKGACVGACLFEGWAKDEAQALAILEQGEVNFIPCHHVNAVGPMGGITSASMPMLVVENVTDGNRAYCNLNEGIGKVMRFGAYGEDVLTRHRWMRDVLMPVLSAALGRMEHGIDLTAMMAQGITMGDEFHQRNIASSALLMRALAPQIARLDHDKQHIAEVMDFLSVTDQFFLNLAMAYCKAAMDAGAMIRAGSIVTAMTRNGNMFGIRVSGLGERWFTAPVNTPQGLFFTGFSQEQANPDMGDSAITETFGIGGAAMIAAPGVTRFVGAGGMEAARAVSEEMAEIYLERNMQLQIPGWDFQGACLGLDIRRVVETGITPLINTGIAHKEAGIGQIGAGTVRAPLACFEQALEALAESMGIG